MKQEYFTVNDVADLLYLTPDELGALTRLGGIEPLIVRNDVKRIAYMVKNGDLKLLARTKDEQAREQINKRLNELSLKSNPARPQEKPYWNE